MAKIRVYELAKDLNMTNKALLNKMKELKIEVKSHMSSLKDSDISKIKKKCMGKAKKKQKDVQNKPPVIRRRKQAAEEIADPEDQETIEIQKETKPEQEKVIKKKKSLSFRVVYRAANRTLKEKNIKKLHTNISKTIIDLFNADLPE